MFDFVLKLNKLVLQTTKLILQLLHLLFLLALLLSPTTHPRILIVTILLLLDTIQVDNHLFLAPILQQLLQFRLPVRILKQSTRWTTFITLLSTLTSAQLRYLLRWSIRTVLLCHPILVFVFVLRSVQFEVISQSKSFRLVFVYTFLWL